MHKIVGLVSGWLGLVLFISLGWFSRGVMGGLSFLETFLVALILSVSFGGPLFVVFKNILGGGSDE